METRQVRVVQDKWARLMLNMFDITDKLHLYKSTFTPVPTSDETDFAANEVAFTGYAAAVLTAAWLPGVDITGRALFIYSSLAVFTQTNTILTDLVGGWYITDTASGILYVHGALDTPFAFDHTGNQLLVKPSGYFDALADADAEEIFGP